MSVFYRVVVVVVVFKRVAVAVLLSSRELSRVVVVNRWSGGDLSPPTTMSGTYILGETGT